MNSFIEIFLMIWIFFCISGMIIYTLTALVFYLKHTENIISLLNDAGFADLSNRINNVVLTIGKLRPYNGFCKESKIYSDSWKEFRNIKIPNIFRSLTRYQLIAKGIDIFSSIYLIVFLSVPVLLILLFIYTVVSKK